MSYRSYWLIFSGVVGAAGVAAGAWAAHGLNDNPAAQQWADTASRYQLLHAAVLAALSVAAPDWGRRAGLALGAARWLLAVGLTLFCGTLYALAIWGVAPFPGSAPMGGTALMAGWLALAAAGWLAQRRG